MLRAGGGGVATKRKYSAANGDTGEGEDWVDNASDSNHLSYILLVGVLYPFLYELIQCYQIGFLDYVTDLGNYIDLVYILGSIAMTFVHVALTPYAFISKVIMAAIVTLAIRRTFNFLRIFSALSPIVTMLTNVIW